MFQTPDALYSQSSSLLKRETEDRQSIYQLHRMIRGYRKIQFYSLDQTQVATFRGFLHLLREIPLTISKFCIIYTHQIWTNL